MPLTAHNPARQARAHFRRQVKPSGIFHWDYTFSSHCPPSVSLRSQARLVSGVASTDCAIFPHIRIPVIPPPAAHTAWLDPITLDVERLQALLRPYPAKEMIGARSARG